MANGRKAPRPLFGLALLLILFGLPFYVSLQSSLSPNGTGVPGMDAGVYIYTAKRVLMGDGLYREVWDHKGPVAYAMQMPARLIFGEDLRGAWLTSLACLIASAFFVYGTLRAFFSKGVAAFGAAAAILALIQVYEGGNLTEDLALPFVCLGYLALSRLLFEPRTGRRFLWAAIIGIGFAAAALTRLNNAAGYAGFALYPLWLGAARRDWRSAIGLTVTVAGAAALTAAIAIFGVVGKDNVSGFVSAFWSYNRLYSVVPLRMRASALKGLLTVSFLSGGLLLLAAGAWSFLFGKQTPGEDAAEEHRLFFRIAFVGAFVTVALSCLSGRPYPHYVTLWVPFVGIFGALALDTLRTGWRREGTSLGVKAALAALGIVYAGLTTVSLFQNLRLGQGRNAAHNERVWQTAAWLKQNTRPEEPVFVWGTGADVLLLADRRSASRFFYWLPITSRGYLPSAPEEVVRELESAKVRVVVDFFRQAPVPRLVPESPEEASPKGEDLYRRDIAPLRDYIRSRFRPETNLSGVRIYVRREAADFPTASGDSPKG